jgi:hypothetical protein
MAKKKTAQKATKAKSTERKESCTTFLRNLYKKQPSISNADALEKLLAAFPESNAGNSSIASWKTGFRAEGMNIPYARVGAKPKEKAVTKSKAKSKTASKKTRKK